MIAFIEENKSRFGVEPICAHLPIAPSTYYAARSRPPSARALADEETKRQILEVHRENYGVYGIEKLWKALSRKGHRSRPGPRRPAHGRPRHRRAGAGQEDPDHEAGPRR
jgi:putative transposase